MERARLVPSSIASLIRQAIPMPTVAEGVRYFLLSCGLGCMITLVQGVMRWVIEWRFNLDSIAFPLALNAIERAGDWDNLVGWGYFINDTYTITSVPQWTFEMVFSAVAGVTMCRILSYGLLLAYAGVVANMLEWGSRGGVLDWIILPNGGDGVRGLSLGDTAIYAGVAWTAVMLVRHVAICLREDFPALLRQHRRSR